MKDWLDELDDDDRNLVFAAADSWRARAKQITAANEEFWALAKDFAEKTVAKNKEFKALLEDKHLTAEEWADRQNDWFRFLLQRDPQELIQELSLRKSERADQNKRFWTALKAGLEGRQSLIAGRREPTHLSWWAFGIGTSRARLVLSVSRKFARVELAIRGDAGLDEKARAKDAHKAFEYLERHKERIGDAYGGDLVVFADELVWDSSREKLCRIRAELPGVSIENEDSDWPKMREWLIDRTLRMERTFSGEFDKMPKAQVPTTGAA